jgi:hypothetical protein
MLKILNKVGIYSKAQYALLKAQNEKLRTEKDEIVYDFDSLLSKYNAVQINCLFYKLVNVCWKDSDKKHLLKRFKKRISSATEESN